ncbi:hypothetical protein GA707_20420 [Nostocoides sp. F2B08]|uniref:nSTAND1 domain-containing NTPase n=1 Tax=Nostocoides sp. F2B08 TaxID=2653936 RepID=UPI001263CD92|nr:BTAD domain-containing putative transcriptional regulator [Tetrasphaera sp. F2B08]KAB7739382.1 hypothetical protein GA707_20420 [Tetrasphaera sp. F2B08]
MRVDVLGSVRVEDGLSLAPRDRRVLAALAISAGVEVSAETLADALWGDEPPASATKVVQGCVSRLRRLLGPDSIRTSGSGYVLDPGAVDLDFMRFERGVALARRERRLERRDLAEVALVEALGLWRGRPLAELDDWEPARAWVAGVQQARLNAEEELLTVQLESGEHDRAVGRALALAEEQPWRERRWALLALAQYRSDRQADALATLRRARSELAGQLGVDPGPELVALESAILRQDPELLEFHRSSAVRGDDECPYPGLEAYDVEDAEMFFGRTETVARIVRRLDEAKVVVLVGDSGVGKSSILRAGVVASLRESGRDVALCMPADDPIPAAQAALAACAGPAVLAVDQLEDSLRTGRVEEWLQWLARRSCDAAPVVASLRSDYVGRLATVPAFAGLAEPGLHLVRPLDGESLREAIEGPAHAFGLTLEPGLVELVVRDAQDQPGAQPLMSHALAETWRARAGRVLTVAGYESVGGISGAVARTAERLHQALDEADRVRLRSIMLRLSSIESGTPSRVRVPRSTFDEPGLRVVEMLVRSRLATSGQGTVELAHEALIRAWPRLRRWLDEDAEGIRIWRHLARAASGWDDLGRPDSELYRGSRLHVAREWRQRAQGAELSELETAFLTASNELEEQERSALERRQVEQVMSNRRLRRLLIGATALLVVALASGMLALDRGRDAVAARAASEQTALVQTSLAMRATDRETAALLALEAYRNQPDAAAYGALLGTFTGAPGYLGRTIVDAPDLLQGAVIPGNDTTAVVAVGGYDLRLLNLETGELTEHFDTPSVERNAYNSEFGVSADGSTLALLSSTAVEEDCGSMERYEVDNQEACTTLSVYDIASGRRLAGPLHPSAGGGGDVAVSPDGTYVAVAGGAAGEVVVFTASGRQVGSVSALDRPAAARAQRDTAAVVFDEAGGLWVGSLGPQLRHVALPEVRVDRTIEVPGQAGHNGLAVTGSMLVAAGDERLVGVDLRTSELVWQVDVSRRLWPCQYLTASAVIGHFYCADLQGGLEERSTANGQLTGRRFDPQQGDPADIGILRDGTELITFSAEDAAFTRWRIDGTGPIIATIGERSEYAVDVPSSGGLIPTATFEDDLTSTGPILLRDLGSGEVRAVLPGAYASWWGDQLVVGDDTGDRLVTNLDPLTVEDLRFPLWPAAMSQDGRRMVVPNPDDDRDLWVVDRESDRTLQHLTLPEGAWVNSLAFSFDASRVFVVLATDDGWKVTYKAAWYDVADGSLHRPDLTGEQVNMKVATDGSVVTGDGAGALSVRNDDLAVVGHLPGSRGNIWIMQTTDTGLFAVNTGDWTVALYDLPSRRMLGDPIGDGMRDALEGMQPGWLDPDGDRLVFNSAFGMRLWDLRSATLVKAACEVAGRNLTRSEWTTYLGVQDYQRTCPQYPAAA